MKYTGLPIYKKKIEFGKLVISEIVLMLEMYDLGEYYEKHRSISREWWLNLTKYC